MRDSQSINEAFIILNRSLEAIATRQADSQSSHEIREAMMAAAKLQQIAKEILVRPKEPEDVVAQEIFRSAKNCHTLSSKPIFILGFPRSGTTLLAWLLDSHPHIAAIPENGLCRYFSATGAPGSGSEFRVEYSDLMNAIARLEMIGETREKFFARIAGLIDGVFMDYATKKGKRRWVDKNVSFGAGLDLLDWIFDYKSQHIYIVRHGFDAALSHAQRIGRRFGPLIDFSIAAHLKNWVATNAAICDFVERNHERCLMIRYEDLVANPLDSAQTIFNFLNEPWVPAIFENMQQMDHPDLGDSKIYATGGKIQSDRMERWKQWPSPVLRQLTAIAGPMLERLGYDTHMNSRMTHSDEDCAPAAKGTSASTGNQDVSNRIQRR